MAMALELAVAGRAAASTKVANAAATKVANAAAATTAMAMVMIFRGGVRRSVRLRLSLRLSLLRASSKEAVSAAGNYQ